MPRFAANLSMLWPELATVPERIGAAARAGFDAAEILFVHDLGLAELRDSLDEHGVRLVLFDADPGNWAAGERGLLCGPDESRFRRSVERAASDAAFLGVGWVNLLAGVPESIPSETALDLCRERLQWAAASYGGSQLGFLVEAINPLDMPGYALSTPDAAAALVEDVAHSRVRLQFDAYHAGMVGRDPREVLAAQRPLIGHVQVADVPGRHEPGTGRLDLIGLLSDLDASGYDGWVGCEYQPTRATEETLEWMRRT